MRRKAQSAMEFLLTYGWAIVIVVIAVAALIYFGILDVHKFMPQRCVISPGVHCFDHEIYKPVPALPLYEFKILLKNNYGKDIEILDIEVEQPFSYGGPLDCYDNNGDAAQTFENDEKFMCVLKSFTRTGGMVDGKYRVDFAVKANAIETGLEQTFQGSTIGYWDEG